MYICVLRFQFIQTHVRDAYRKLSHDYNMIFLDFDDDIRFLFGNFLFDT